MSLAKSTCRALPRSVFISHGGGPCFFYEASGPFSAIDKNSRVAADFRKLSTVLPKPKAIVVCTAHWEADGPKIRVTGQPAPSLVYDYYGFPAETYKLTYPAPGDPQLAADIVALLKGAGISAELELERGFDHGVFIPLKMIYPDADVPVVAISLSSTLDPAFHISVGKALSGLADRGVLVFGSGMATHNLGMVRSAAAHGEGAPVEPRAGAFIDWLKATLGDGVSAQERERRLLRWTEAPHARHSHPREEHLLPLHVAAGAAGFAAGELVLDATVFGGMSMASFAFGQQ
eukprot:TRINITY_DN12518_c0_g1_i1.p1 TRINITY_DN12518_c0_g1~~TRINITY_DN12518_c0_g1_i1.p1  ORF type:complete len:290 (+),score=84.82 TRINITY_DN12518_c0_g1_i1:180-1049(+)